MFQLRGRANVPFTVQERTVVVDAVTGQADETWADVGTVWASVETRGGLSKGEYEDTLQAMERKVVVIDWRDDIDWSVKDTRLESVEVTRDKFSIVEISDPGCAITRSSSPSRRWSPNGFTLAPYE
jgi:head-tail adaptor